MDRTECPKCHQFHPSHENSHCRSDGQNSRYSKSELETIEKLKKFLKGTSDYPDDSFRQSNQASYRDFGEHLSAVQSRSQGIPNEWESIVSSAEVTPVNSSSHLLPISPQYSNLSGVSLESVTVSQLNEDASGVQSTVGDAFHSEDRSRDETVPKNHPLCSASASATTAGPSKISFEYSGESNNSCSFCARIFANKMKLRRHIGVHTGEKEFECGSCGCGFTGKYCLNKHLHSSSGKEPFICERCGNSFPLKCGLESHFCPKYGTKNFTCDICKKRLSSKKTLKNHRRSHSADNPIKCIPCNTGFTTNSNLRQHQEKFH
ncbi:Gastrula zinc finger protein xFG20-1 [Araneus ventricosus]|uniref:Gastrula zinc finger protein xFG20-1 n=1 Tax=Araneus ventricosus TaxID=182803 RepID=A0A4Y2VXL9_ARAVE|nr:Gastrula zinc finger protein xFG20-1 [Araneus ventricosus]